MKIGIVGAGAMGSVYGAILGDAGNEVWLLDVWKEQIEAIRARGVRVEGASGDRTVGVNATLDAKEAGVCELLIVATKAMDTEAAVKNAAPMIGAETLLLTIQNGLGNAERMERLVGAKNLLVGIAGGFGASVVGPGHVHHNGWEAIHLGEFQGGLSERLNRVAEVWRKAGFKVRVFDDIQPLVWGKLMGNVGFSAVCTVTGLTVGEVIASPEAWSITEALVREAFAVAQAKKIVLPYDDPVRWVREFASKMPRARPSMLQDMEAGRRTEIDSINGGVVREAEALGVPVPVNRVMCSLVRTMETGRGG
ncbi:MAG: ketopantoate reductase family protein [Candidatus Methylomirabilia bacterium]